MLWNYKTTDKIKSLISFQVRLEFVNTQIELSLPNISASAKVKHEQKDNQKRSYTNKTKYRISFKRIGHNDLRTKYVKIFI